MSPLGPSRSLFATQHATYFGPYKPRTREPALSRRVEIAAVAHIAAIEIIVGLVVRLIVGIVAKEAAAAGIVRRCRAVSAAADVAEARIAGHIAAAAIAPAVPRRCCCLRGAGA